MGSFTTKKIKSNSLGIRKKNYGTKKEKKLNDAKKYLRIHEKIMQINFVMKF